MSSTRRNATDSWPVLPTTVATASRQVAVAMRCLKPSTLVVAHRRFAFSDYRFQSARPNPAVVGSILPRSAPARSAARPGESSVSTATRSVSAMPCSGVDAGGKPDVKRRRLFLLHAMMNIIAGHAGPWSCSGAGRTLVVRSHLVFCRRRDCAAAHKNPNPCLSRSRPRMESRHAGIRLAPAAVSSSRVYTSNGSSNGVMKAAAWL